MWDPRVVQVSDNLIGNISVSVQIKWKEGTNWWFSAIYGPCNPRNRDLFWDEIAGLHSICWNNWCVGGDFVVRNLSEKMNSTTYTTSMHCFDAWIEELGLHDPSLLNARLTALPRITSDHHPIIFDTTRLKWGPSPFRFENVWLTHNNFKESLEDWWGSGNTQGWEGYKFMMKLKETKNRVLLWNKEVFGNVDYKISELRNKISRLDEREAEGMWSEQLNETRRESRSNKATIDKIELEDGSLTSDELKIENEIIGYYNKLYKKSGGDGSGLDGVEWRPVTLMKAEQLERPFSEEEIRGAVLECDGAKAPGRMDLL
ncbi:uncharacterized protein LOC142535418 [Primulina tabacum]|uniref:uncharacterized protein LOC142535418 n=1 Tax=Primulina tabacum TaxID=48773 RepID=UPI003F5ACC84